MNVLGQYPFIPETIGSIKVQFWSRALELVSAGFLISMFTKPCIKLIFKNQFASNVISLELSAVCFLLCADKFLPPMNAFANRAFL